MGTYILTSGGRYQNGASIYYRSGGKYVTQGQILTDYGRGRYLRYGQYKGIWTICPDSPIVSLRAIACIAATKKDKRKGRRTNVCAGFVRERLCIPFLKIYPPHLYVQNVPFLPLQGYFTYNTALIPPQRIRFYIPI